MVIWSYLLLGLPVDASLDRVLAPIDGVAFGARDAGFAASHEHESSGATASVVEEKSIDEMDLLAEIERQLTNRLQPAGRLRLIPTSAMPRVSQYNRLPEVLLLDHPTRLASSTMLVRLRLQDGDRVLGNHAITFRVQVMAEVWSPTRRLAIRDVLLSGDVELREVDLIREARAVPADSSLFGHYEIARAVTPDRVLTWNDLSPRELVRRGGTVNVVASDGMLSISMKALATRGGAKGDVVTVRNLESLREFPAEVIDENTVRVRF